MKLFKISITSQTPKVIDGISSHFGEIVIGEFQESFVVPIEDWPLEQYLQQWQHGIKKIKIDDTSCLVTSVQNINTSYPTIEMWSLYKEKNTVFFQNNLLFNETTAPPKKLNNFTIDSCYDFVTIPRTTIDENGEKISEWHIDITAL